MLAGLETTRISTTNANRDEEMYALPVIRPTLRALDDFAPFSSRYGLSSVQVLYTGAFRSVLEYLLVQYLLVQNLINNTQNSHYW